MESSSTLEIAASLGNMDLGNKPLEVSTEVDGVQFDGNTVHLICVDGEALSYTHSAETAANVMRTIVRDECKRIQEEKGEWFEISFRKDKEDGTKYAITQISLGRLYNGSVADLHVFTSYPVSHARMTKRKVILTTTDISVESSVVIQ